MADRTLTFDILARDKASSTLQKVGRETDTLGTRMRGFGALAAKAVLGTTAAIGGLAVAGATMGVKTAASLEQAQIGFTTLLKSGQKADVFLRGLTRFAASTPFELPGLIESSRLLVGVGVSTKDTMKILKSFGDAASAVGVGQEAFQRIMLATSQAISAGRFTIEDLNQITENGIPIWTVLAKATGKPIPVLRDLATKGELLSKDVLPILEKQMGKDYGGAMARQSKTLNGLWSTFTDTLNIGLATAIKPLVPWMKDRLADATRIAGKAFERLPGVIDAVMTKFGEIKKFVVEKLVPALTTELGKIGGLLPKIDLTALGKSLAEQATTWAGSVIGGVQTGLDKGDWAPLGRSLGEGLSKALSAAAGLSADIGKAVGRWVASVDWVEVGRTAGKTAFPFAVGFMATLFDGVITAAKEHPMDTLLLAVSFIPLGKLASSFKPLRNLIEKLPFGRWVTWALDHSAVPAFDAISRFVKFIGRGFTEGFAKHFPGVVTGLRSRLTGLVDDIVLRALYAKDAAVKFVRGIAVGIGSGIGRVARAVVDVIAAMTRPFRTAAGWLIGRGREFVSGLIRGVTGLLGPAADVAWRVVSTVTAPFRGAGRWRVGRGQDVMRGLLAGIRAGWRTVEAFVVSIGGRITRGIGRASDWLYSSGKAVLTGFWNGMRSAWTAVTRWVSGIAGWIRSHKGPISADLQLLVPAGRALMEGFLRGLQSGAGPAWDFVSRVGGKTRKALESTLLGGMATGGMSGVQPARGGLSSAEAWIIARESGGRTTADNPTSTAFGLGQLLLANRIHYGAIVGASAGTTDYNAQLAMFRLYVRDRYGTAERAQAFWQSHGWYDRGGVATGAGLWAKGTSAPERVLSPAQTRSFDRLVRVLDRGGGTTGTTVVNVTVQNHGVLGSRVEVQDWLVRSLRDLQRTGRLA